MRKPKISSHRNHHNSNHGGIWTNGSYLGLLSLFDYFSKKKKTKRSYLKNYSVGFHVLSDCMAPLENDNN